MYDSLSNTQRGNELTQCSPKSTISQYVAFSLPLQKVTALFITLQEAEEKQRGKQHISNKLRSIVIDDIIHYSMCMREAGWKEQHTQSYSTNHNCAQHNVSALNSKPFITFCLSACTTSKNETPPPTQWATWKSWAHLSHELQQHTRRRENDQALYVIFV